MNIEYIFRKPACVFYDKKIYDEYRKNKLDKLSFVKVMQDINLLKKHGVEWNAMAVVNDFNTDYPLEFYNFFLSSTYKCNFLGADNKQ